MSDSSSSANTGEPRGAEFLELLETKHNHVLTELDALNERIEKVLNMYASSRSAGAAAANSPAPPRKAA